MVSEGNINGSFTVNIPTDRLSWYLDGTHGPSVGLEEFPTLIHC